MPKSVRLISDYCMKIPLLINDWEPDLSGLSENGEEYEINDNEGYHKALGKVCVEFFNQYYTPAIKRVFPEFKATFYSIDKNGPWGVVSEVVMNTNITTKEVQDFITSRITKGTFLGRYTMREIKTLRKEHLDETSFQEYLFENNKSYEGFASSVPQEIEPFAKCKEWWYKYNNVLGFLCKDVKLPSDETITYYLLENDPYMDFVSKVE